jgi:fluoride exporter
MRVAFWVALLGALGSLCRWLLVTAVQKATGQTFPAGTMVVNVLGSVAIGVVMGFFITRGTEGSTLRLGLTAGFLGGFTTYSAFAVETLLLIERRSFASAAANVIGTLTICLVGCGLGLVVGRAAGR